MLPQEPTGEVTIPDRLPGWLVAFLRDALLENDTLVENGARHAAVARAALLNRLIQAATAYQDTELDIDQAAKLTGRHPETIRRAVRSGALPDLRANPRGHHRVRRADLDQLARPRSGPYDPKADAQDIAKLRRLP